MVFSKQQILGLNGDSVNIGGYGAEQILKVSGYKINLTNLAIAPVAITTTTTSAINDIVNAPMVITIGWTAPVSDGGSALTGYDISEDVAGGGYSIVASVGPTVTTYDRTTTQTNANHNYQITAVNNVGSSAFSATTTTTTPSEPSPPTGLTLTPIDNDTLQLDWTAPTTAANSGQLSPVT